MFFCDQIIITDPVNLVRPVPFTYIQVILCYRRPHFEYFKSASGISRDQQKCETLLPLLREEGQEIFESLSGDDQSFNQTMT